MASLISRSEWGARFDYARRHGQRFRSADPRKVEAVLHTSVTVAPDLVPPWDDDDEAVRILERIGTQRFGSGISYNVAVTPSGRRYEGQPLDNKATHSEYGDWNYTRASIVLVGNTEEQPVTDAAVLAVAVTLAEWVRDGTIRATKLRGHFEVAAKACPGRYAIARMPEMTRLADEMLAGRVPMDDVPPPAVEEDIMASAEELREIVRAEVTQAIGRLPAAVWAHQIADPAEPGATRPAAQVLGYARRHVGFLLRLLKQLAEQLRAGVPVVDIARELADELERRAAEEPQ